jgi:hypothetical protein
MKETSWEWVSSKQKTAAKIMWETQGQDYDYVISRIMEACEMTNLNARALYRRLCRDGMVEQGFVPAPAKVGRPRKDGSAPTVGVVSGQKTVIAATPAPVHVEPEPEPERTVSGERKSIADMKAYLEELKKKASA